MISSSPEWVFVIDTNRYAGNFERAMCAYITGEIGECGVGDECAELFKNEVPDSENKFADCIDQVSDEHGCCRPASIWTTPGRFNNGLGGCFDDGKEQEAVKHYEKERLKLNKKGHDVPKLERLVKHGAYESVAIFFNESPTNGMIELMKSRAKKFIVVKPDDEFGEYEGLEIKGFRLLKLKSQPEYSEQAV